MGAFIITGGTGFVGSNLAKRLIDLNHKVYLICRESSNLNILEEYKDKVNIFIYKENIDDLISFMKSTEADCIFHLASLFIAEHNSSDVVNLIDSNLKFSTVILEGAYKASIKNFINTGSFWQHYENSDYDPVCLYGATKEAFEKIMDYYINTKKINAITLTLFDTYGESDTRNKLINSLKQISLSGKVLEMSAGEQKMDLTHIDDVIAGYIQAYKNINENYNGIHEKYTLSSERLLTLKEVINIFEKETGYKLNINWGSRNYRQREVMTPWRKFKLLPNWKSTIYFEKGVKTLVK